MLRKEFIADCSKAFYLVTSDADTQRMAVSRAIELAEDLELRGEAPWVDDVVIEPDQKDDLCECGHTRAKHAEIYLEVLEKDKLGSFINECYAKDAENSNGEYCGCMKFVQVTT